MFDWYDNGMDFFFFHNNAFPWYLRTTSLHFKNSNTFYQKTVFSYNSILGYVIILKLVCCQNKAAPCGIFHLFLAAFVFHRETFCLFKLATVAISLILNKGTIPFFSNWGIILKFIYFLGWTSCAKGTFTRKQSRST